MASLASILIKINADGTEAEKEFKTFEKRVKSLSSSIADTGKSLSKWITVPMTALAALSVRNANIQQQAEARLLNALNGRADVSQRLIKYAGELQERSTLGDEAIIAQQAFLASLGLTEQQIIDTIEAAAQLSYATGMSLDSAVKNLAKTYGGLAGELGESIPAMKTLTKEEMMQGAAVKFVNDNYKGFAETAAKTGAGTLTQLKNQLGDLAEQIGFILLPVLQKITAALKTVTEWMQNLQPATQTAIVAVASMAATLGPLLTVVSKIAKILPAIVKGFNLVRGAIGAIAGPAGLATTTLIGLITSVGILRSDLENLEESQRDKKLAEIARRQQQQAEYKVELMPVLSELSDSELEQKLAQAIKDQRYYESRVSSRSIGGTEEDRAKYYDEMTREADFAQATIDAINKIIDARKRNIATQTETMVLQRQADGLIGSLQARIRALEESMPWLRTRDEIIGVQREISILQEQLDDLQSSYDVLATPVTAENADLGGLDLGKVKPVEFDPAVVAGRAAIERGRTESTSAFRAWGQSVIDISAEVGTAISQAVEDMLVGFGEALGDLMSGDDFNPLESLLKVLGNALQQMGKMLIKAGLMAESIRESIKTMFANPFVAIAVGVAAVALGKMLSNMSQKTVALANGGLAYGPTLALVGDNPSAASDPEVIAPLSKLRGMLNTSGTRISFEGAEFTISGDQLRAVLDRNSIRVNALG